MAIIFLSIFLILLDFYISLFFYIMNNLKDPEMIQKIELGENKIKIVKFCPFGKNLAIGDEAGKIYIINLKNPGKIHTLTGHQKKITTLCFSLTEENTLYSSSEDKTLKKWSNIYSDDFNNIDLNSPITQLKILKTNNFFITGNKIGEIKMWQITKKITESQNTILTSLKTQINTILTTDDCTILIIGTESGNIIIRNLILNREEFRLEGNSQNPNPVTSMSLHPDQCIFASGLQNGEIVFIDLRTKSVYCRIEAHFDRVGSCFFHKSLKYFVSAGFDGNVRIRDLVKGENIFCLKIKKKVESLDFSKGNEYFVTAQDFNVVFWKINLDCDEEERILFDLGKRVEEVHEDFVLNNRIVGKINKIGDSISKLKETLELFNKITDRSCKQLDYIENHFTK